MFVMETPTPYYYYTPDACTVPTTFKHLDLCHHRWLAIANEHIKNGTTLLTHITHYYKDHKNLHRVRASQTQNKLNKKIQNYPAPR